MRSLNPTQIPQPSLSPRPRPSVILAVTLTLPSPPQPLPLSRRALHRAPQGNPACPADLPAPLGAREDREGGEEREAGDLCQSVDRVREGTDEGHGHHARVGSGSVDGGAAAVRDLQGRAGRPQLHQGAARPTRPGVANPSLTALSRPPSLPSPGVALRPRARTRHVRAVRTRGLLAALRRRGLQKPQHRRAAAPRQGQHGSA